MVVAARKLGLTDRSIQALKPSQTGDRYIAWDAIMPGLAVRVSAKGKRSFYAVKRRAGQSAPTWVLLGVYPVMTLGEARAAAREILGALIAGEDPTSHKMAKRRAAEAAARAQEESKFAAVAEDFIKRHVAKLRTAREVEGIIRRELIPTWGERPITEITRRDVIKLTEAILDSGGERPAPGTRRKEGGPYAARHALFAARGLFNWAVGRDLLEFSPCDRIRTAELLGASEARDRVLTDNELRRVWLAAQVTPYPFGPLVQLLIITGQRRDEIAAARWREIDLDRALLTIGAERMKAKAGHTVPLTPTSTDLLRNLPRFTGGDYIFSGQAGRRPFSGFSKSKARLDRTVGEIAPYTLHDLRRTVRTRLAELGVSPFIGELILAHTQKGVHATYDRHTYDDQKRDALERWEKRLLAIVAAEPLAANIVTLPARARL